ncbi:MAG TPA: hypothetical protein VFO85_05025, partial [Vicinamibacteria bacterium]|nr:hypothetical protein [Vicinamibacteria bacterium]
GLAALALTAAALAAACGGRRPMLAAAPAPSVESAPASVAPPPATGQAAEARDDLFHSDVKPLLMRKCAPCHAPGGTLYATLPFDDPEVVRPRYAKMRGRLSAEERVVLERWLALPEAPAPSR